MLADIAKESVWASLFLATQVRSAALALFELKMKVRPQDFRLKLGPKSLSRSGVGFTGSNLDGRHRDSRLRFDMSLTVITPFSPWIVVWGYIVETI